MECVPNFSEGRDLEKIEKIVDKFRAKAGVKLLDYSNDEDHNRLVVTVVGEPEALKDALLEAVGQAVELIDLAKHSGQHPRMGAVDVVPFIPIKGCTMDEAIALSREVGEKVAALYQIPVFLYENRLRPRIGRTWQLSARENLKGWRKRSSCRNGNRTSDLPSGIRRQEPWQLAPVCRWSLIMSIWGRQIWI